jgi:hypothetical protein
MIQEMERLIAEKRKAREELDADIQALERARGILLKDSKKAPTLPFTAGTGSPSARRGRRPSKDSDIAVAVAVLAAHGQPMYLDEIVDAMTERGRKVNRLSIGGTLARRAKEGKMFFRTSKPNTFGLLEWNKPNGSSAVNYVDPLA